MKGRADMVVLDARRFDEYQTMSIPTGVSVPGAELVLRARAMAPNPQTRIIVNCAGRTRSIIGTQSLVNAGIPNPVAALRNGTIGWTLAGWAQRSRGFMFDRDFALSLLSSDQDALYEIDEAIKRIEKGTYGVCELTGKSIPKARLEAIVIPRSWINSIS